MQLPDRPPTHCAEVLALIDETNKIVERLTVKGVSFVAAENQCRACGREIAEGEPTCNYGACEDCWGYEGYGLCLQGHRAHVARLRSIEEQTPL